MLKTLKQKLLALVLLSIGGTLLATGLALSFLLQKSHEASNNQALRAYFERSAAELQELHLRSTLSRNELLSRQEIIDSLYLITAYADPDNYQSIIFDEEKKKLSQLLLLHARSSGDALISLFDDKGMLVAFARHGNDTLQGIVTLRDGRSVMLVSEHVRGQDSGWHEVSADTPKDLPPLRYQAPAEGTRFIADEIHIGVESTGFIERRFPDGDKALIGNLRVQRMIDEEFLKVIASRFSGLYSFVTPEGKELGDEIHAGPALREAVVPELFSVHEDDAIYYPDRPFVQAFRVDPWQHPERPFVQAFRVPLANERNFYVVGSVDSNLAATQASQIKEVAIAVFLVAALLLLPVVLWFSRRAIVAPIQHLEDSARALGDGRYDINIPSSGSAEVDTLAQALLSTARTVHQREQELRTYSDMLEQRVEDRTSDLSKANDSLSRSQQMLQLVMDSIPQYVFWKDTNSVYMGCNANFLQAAGLQSVQELIGKNDYDLPWAKEEADFYRQLDRAVMDSDQPRYHIQETQQTASGEQIIVDTNKIPLHDADGKVIGILGAYDDITQRVRDEQQLREAKETAEQASHAKSDFLSRMSHELRTPLNAILGFAQLLMLPGRDSLSESQKDHTQEIITAGQHLLHLISEILDLSRIEAGSLSLDIEPIDLTDTVNEAIALVDNVAEHHRIRLIKQVEQHQPRRVLADALRIRQVLVNLLGNAIKYNRPNGTVTLRCHPQDNGMLCVEVVDTGIGIAEHNRHKLFRPFERLGVEKTGIDGTGIGLVIAKELVERMGGEIGVRSTADQGSTFWFTLPLANEATARTGQPAPAAPAADAGASPTTGAAGSSRVLYIEDNHANFRLIDSLMAELPGIELLWAESGSEGIEMTRQFQPGVILMDMRMPGLTGEETFLQLLNDPATRHIPVVALSANAMPDDIESALALGFSRYLTKPVSMQELTTTLEGLLGQRLS